MNSPKFATPLDVETAFFSAFERADAEAMREVWDTSEDIECIHPLGNRLRGSAIHTAWKEVFAKADPVVFHVSGRRAFTQDGLTVHLVYADILFQDQKTEPLRLLSTNVYRQGNNGWRMVLHHASPAPFAQTPAAARKAVH